jgi:virginiamycin A acetyltransferase
VISSILYKLYPGRGRTVRRFIRWIVFKLEGGQFYSKTLRKIMKDYHGVEIGMYTHGGCFEIHAFERETKIGRYCSIAVGAKGFTLDHPLEFKSTHGFFFNPNCGYIKAFPVKPIPLEIGHDVWIGDGAKILANVTSIGTGAVLGAGSVLSRNLPPYAVAVGHPARIVRYRFPVEVIDELLASKWWEKDIEEILPDIGEYTQNYLNVSKKNAEPTYDCS